MADNVVPLIPAQDPDIVLEKAKGGYSSVLVLGWDKDDKLDVRASMDLKPTDILWLIEQFKMKLVRGDYHGGEDS